ncbi:MAG: mechanosensitive ion channel family protein [Theionarchaea archaeon]|nr:mechanosensitive ion channel family protein [Theionarchaea archaeon]
MIDVTLRNVLEIIAVAAGGILSLKAVSVIFRKISSRTQKTDTLWDDIVFEFVKKLVQFSIISAVFYFIMSKVDNTTISQFLEIVLIFLAAYLAIHVITFIMDLFKNVLIKESETRLDDLVFPMLKTGLSIGVYLIALLISLDQLGYNVSGLLAGMGIAGIAVSLAAKDSLSNVIAGILLLMDKPFLPGDRIELWNAPPNQATWGDVVEVGLRSTKIMTTDNITIIVPNSELMKRDIINYTEGSSMIRLRIPASVSYDSNLVEVEKVLINTLIDIKGIEKIPEPQVVVTEFGDSSINVELRVWISDAKSRRSLQDEINRRIKMEFEKSSIEIPYPKRDLYVKEMNSPHTDTESFQ